MWFSTIDGNRHCPLDRFENRAPFGMDVVLNGPTRKGTGIARDDDESDEEPSAAQLSVPPLGRMQDCA